MHTTIIKNSQIWIWIALWTIFFVVLLIINYYFLNQNRYIILSAIACMIAPLIFFDKILKRNYSEKIEIGLNDDLWMFFIVSDGIERKYYLNDIISFGINHSSNGKSSRLAFKLKGGNLKSINITMYAKEQSTDQTKTEEILKSFQSMIYSYNNTIGINDKITFNPTFEESVYGLVVIYFLSGLLLLAIALHIIYGQVGTLPLSLLFGGGILIRLIAVRIRDIKRRKENENRQRQN